MSPNKTVSYSCPPTSPCPPNIPGFLDSMESMTSNCSLSEMLNQTSQTRHKIHGCQLFPILLCVTSHLLFMEVGRHSQEQGLHYSVQSQTRPHLLSVLILPFHFRKLFWIGTAKQEVPYLDTSAKYIEKNNKRICSVAYRN